WVLHAVYVGQVVPLIAASVLIAWRLLRENRDVAAGLVLSLVVLKPQAAAIAPFALLAAGRYRAFAACVAAAAAVAGASLLTLGPHGLAEYRASLDLLPASSSDVTLGGAFGLSGAALAFCGALIVVAALVTARRVRSDPGIALGIRERPLPARGRGLDPLARAAYAQLARFAAGDLGARRHTSGHQWSGRFDA
ncbi:MAG: DUF2029 domain-containing protein, partial [Chloroflexi bacterium]